MPHMMKLCGLAATLIACSLAAQAQPKAAPPPPATAHNAQTTDAAAGAEPPSTALGPVKPVAPTRIDQVRQGKRIVEVVITPQGYQYQYRMTHPELKPLQNGPNRQGDGLSVPHFINLSF